MDNPTRTALHHAEISRRRTVLEGELGAIFGRGRPFVWELGAGHGHFLTAYAAAHPDALCIGIDLVAERVERARRKAERIKASNLHFLRAEARLFLDTLPPAARFQAVFILFPDPWPKLRHRKHRIVQSAVLDAIAQRAQPNCRLYFRTDYSPYFADTLALLNTHKKWMLASDPWPFEFETVFQARAPQYHSLVARLREPGIS